MLTSEAKRFASKYGLTYKLDFWQIEFKNKVVGACLTYPGAKKLAAKFDIQFDIDRWLATGENGVWACHYVARCGDIVLETTGYADSSTDRSQTVKTFPARMAEKRAKVTLVMDMMLRKEAVELDLVDEETYEANKRENGWDETRQENNEALPPGATTAEPRASVPAPTATPTTDPY